MPSVIKRGKKYRGLVRITGHKSESQSFNTHREAKEWATNRENELLKLNIKSPEVTLDALIGRYLLEIAPRRKMAPSHADHDIPQMRKRVQGMRLIDLAGRGLMDWVIRNNDVSGSTIGWHISRLCGVLKQCETYWEIGVPWADIQVSREKLKAMGLVFTPVERDRRVSNQEIALIKQNLRPTTKVNMTEIIDFCVSSAMRIGEVCRITWNDLNEAERTVVIRDRKHPRKKYGNHMVVPLLGDSMRIVHKQPVRDERIFPHNPMYLSKLFHLSVVKAGIEDVVLHDLRHEGISRLFEAGFLIQEVALVSGHRDWKDLARYTHIKPQSLVAKEKRMIEAKKKEGVQQPGTDPQETTTFAAHPAPQGHETLRSKSTMEPSV